MLGMCHDPRKSVPFIDVNGILNDRMLVLISEITHRRNFRRWPDRSPSGTLVCGPQDLTNTVRRYEFFRYVFIRTKGRRNCESLPGLLFQQGLIRRVGCAMHKTAACIV